MKRAYIEENLLSDKASLWLTSIENDIKDVFPELAPVVGFGKGLSYMKDLWWHIKLVVDQSPPNPLIKWAALFHDVGKVKTFKMDKGLVTFHGHEVVSSRIFQKFAKRTKFFSDEEIDKITRMISMLGQIESYESDWTDSAVRRLHKACGDIFLMTIELSKADSTTKHDHKRIAYRKKADELYARAMKIQELDSTPPLLPKGLGDEVSRVFNIPPSKKLGDMMNKIRSMVESNEIQKGQSIEYYISILEKMLFNKPNTHYRLYLTSLTWIWFDFNRN